MHVSERLHVHRYITRCIEPVELPKWKLSILSPSRVLVLLALSYPYDHDAIKSDNTLDIPFAASRHSETKSMPPPLLQYSIIHLSIADTANTCTKQHSYNTDQGTKNSLGILAVLR